jgi:hypothetical protein
VLASSVKASCNTVASISQSLHWRRVSPMAHRAALLGIAALALLASSTVPAFVDAAVMANLHEGRTEAAHIVVVSPEHAKSNPNGHDGAGANNMGGPTAAIVVSTLHEAAAAAASLSASGDRRPRVVIELSAGLHRLTSPLRLTREHSNILWRGQKRSGRSGSPTAVVSGGVPVTGWTESKVCVSHTHSRMCAYALLTHVLY